MSLHTQKTDSSQGAAAPISIDALVGALNPSFVQDVLSKSVAFGVLPKEGFVRLDKVLEVIPVGKSSWWAGVQAGVYPTPKHPSPSTSAWDVADIRALIERIRNGE